jgi:hypothetical protein
VWLNKLKLEWDEELCFARVYPSGWEPDAYHYAKDLKEFHRNSYVDGEMFGRGKFFDPIKQARLSPYEF